MDSSQRKQKAGVVVLCLGLIGLGIWVIVAQKIGSRGGGSEGLNAVISGVVLVAGGLYGLFVVQRRRHGH